MLPHNIKAYTAILNEMPESEVHHHLIMLFCVHKNPDLEWQKMCDEILSRRFGVQKYEEMKLKAFLDIAEQDKQRKRLYGNWSAL